MVIDQPGERIVSCFGCGHRESAPSLAPAVQAMADHSVDAGCSSDDLQVIPADRMHLLVNSHRALSLGHSAGFSSDRAPQSRQTL